MYINENYKVAPGAGPRQIRGSVPCQDSSQGLSTPEARNTRKLLFPPNQIANTFPAPSALGVMGHALTLSLYYQHTYCVRSTEYIWMIFNTRVQPHSTSDVQDLQHGLIYLQLVTSSAQHRRSHARKNWTANGAFIDHTLIPNAFLILGNSRTLYIFHPE